MSTVSVAIGFYRQADVILPAKRGITSVSACS